MRASDTVGGHSQDWEARGLKDRGGGAVDRSHDVVAAGHAVPAAYGAHGVAVAQGVVTGHAPIWRRS